MILAVTAVPIFHRLNVFTAYEYLEGRFDLKTRQLAAWLFLIQRGLAAGLTIYAPALILSVILGWSLTWMNIAVGVLVIIYTASGGTKAVSYTQFQQMLVITVGMFIAFFMIFQLLPADVGFLDATRVAGNLGKLNAIDWDFDPSSRYNIWSGILGGVFLMLSYFGTDQSQVQRYLTGSSVAESRIGLLFNGMIKIPMQFFILFLGTMVFVFYQFNAPPIFFNPEPVDKVLESSGPDSEEMAAMQEAWKTEYAAREDTMTRLVEALRSDDPALRAAAEAEVAVSDERLAELRGGAMVLMKKHDPDMAESDTNFVFLTFVVNYLPVGIVGLLIAAILFASMSSTSSELNALASTSVVDIYKRWVKPDESETHYLLASKLATVGWGFGAIGFAMFAGHLGTLVEAVNVLGSLFYGSILGIFLVAFYIKKIGGTATFFGGLGGFSMVLLCYLFTDIAYLWYNPIGCLLTIAFAAILQATLPPRPEPPADDRDIATAA